MLRYWLYNLLFKHGSSILGWLKVSNSTSKLRLYVLVLLKRTLLLYFILTLLKDVSSNSSNILNMLLLGIGRGLPLESQSLYYWCISGALGVLYAISISIYLFYLSWLIAGNSHYITAHNLADRGIVSVEFGCIYRLRSAKKGRVLAYNFTHHELLGKEFLIIPSTRIVVGDIKGTSHA